MAYHHEGPPPPEAYEDVGGFRSTLRYYKRTAHDLTMRGPTVFDRGIHCDLVYSTVLRGEPTSSPQEVDDFCKWFRAVGGFTVLMLPDFRVCHSRWLERANRGEELVERERFQQFRAIYHGYANLRVRAEKPYDWVVTENWDSPAGGFPCQVLCRGVKKC
jgi:hypothetical protein